MFQSITPALVAAALLCGPALLAPLRAATRLTGDLPRRAQLGFGLRLADGALLVRDLDAASPAAQAGLADGDRLLAVNGAGWQRARDGRERLRGLAGGATASLEVDGAGGRRQIGFTPEPLPLEQIEGIDSVYGVVDTPDGARLRTVISRPAGTPGRLPLIFLTQWVSCDGVEPLGGSAWDQIQRGLIQRSGAAFARVDRSSGGDSRGQPCHELDYETELAQYGAALDHLLRDPGVDPQRLVIFGMSLGSTTAPLLAQGRPVAGVLVSGAGALTYFERMLNFDRIGFERDGTSPEQVDALVRRSAEFHVEYLLRGKDPEAIARELPHLAGHWERLRGTGDGVHYGRPYAWHRQLAARDLMRAWSGIQAPVLVVYGELDQFEPPHAFQRIAAGVERLRPGSARAVGVPGMNHFYRVFADAEAAARDEPGHDAPELALAPILTWLRDVVGVKP